MPYQFQPDSLVATGLAQILTLSPNGIEFEHYRAQHSTGYDCDDRPDYLSPDPGDYGSGIKFVANLSNPIRGAFCPPKRSVCFGKDGVTFQAETELYVPVDLGPVYQLFERRPKLQDKFIILGQTYYASGPAVPCVRGNLAALWKIPLMLSQIPVESA